MAQLKFRLKEALIDYESRTGIRLTYDLLSKRTQISIDTLKSMATRDDYNSSLKNITAICEALRCNPLEYLLWND
jgi:DNA-binding Xre family transcriptional regulator